MINLNVDTDCLSVGNHAEVLFWYAVQDRDLSIMQQFPKRTSFEKWEGVVEKLKSQMPGARTLGHSVTDWNSGICIATQEQVAYLSHSGRNWDLSLAAESEEALKAWKAIYEAWLPEPQVEEDVRIPMHFYAVNRMGQATARVRPIETNKWDDIRENYPPKIVRALNATMALERPDSGGKLLLWHGLPGTGKTNCIRALVNAWGRWCRPSYVMDPEAFLGEAGYMNSVIFENDSYEQNLTIGLWDDDDLTSDPGIDQHTKRPKWTLLIIEDADEFLASDAKERTGQALSRLLNVSDGLIGQGLNLLTLITTNVEIDAIHKAVARQGRCLANLNFGTFEVPEANAWLKRHGYVGDPAKGALTLAEMYEMVSPSQIEETEESMAMSVGQYL